MLLVLVSTATGGLAQGDDVEWRGTPQEQFYESSIMRTYQCDTCHTVTNRGGTVGPILNQIGNRRNEEWIRRWLEDPNAVKPGTKMPKFEFTPKEYEEAVGFLTTMKRELHIDSILVSDAPPHERGEALFQEYDCLACHRLGATGRFVGPDLTWLSRRKTRTWERVWLKDPDAWKSGTFMPDFDLSAGAIEDLTAYLETLDGQQNPASREWEFNVNFFLNNRADRRGQLIFRRAACWSCHGEEGRGGVSNPNASPTEEIPDLRHAANDFRLEELQQLMTTRRESLTLDPNTEPPPFLCPDYDGVLTDEEFDDLYAYLETLAPKRRLFRFR